MKIPKRITAAFRVFAVYPRNRAAVFTAAFHTFAFCPRNRAAVFTAAFCAFPFCLRNSRRSADSASRSQAKAAREGEPAKPERLAADC